MTVAYPLQWPDGWPRATVRDGRSPFRLTFDKALQELGWELERLGAKDIVLSSWLELRRDGKPRADKARVQLVDPGVAVYFVLRSRQMVMARDGYRTVCDNLISMFHAVCHLRGLERHGGAHMMERAFTGFVAISDKPHWKMTLNISADENPTVAFCETRYRALAKRFQHDHDQMVELNLAIEQARKELRDGA